MQIVNSWTGAPLVARHLRNSPLGVKQWQLRWMPVCSSTETILSKWLKQKPFLGNQSRAVLAARQTRGIGQRGKIWESQKGGVWISAAMPLFETHKNTGVFGLAVAVSLSERLEAFGIPVKIKWPNDLIVENRKLAGLLPRLLHRGEHVRIARLGLGMNVSNRVPKGGISVAQILSKRNCATDFWAAEVLRTLDQAMDFFKETDLVCQQAERRLWAKEVCEVSTGELWKIEGISPDGALKVRKGLVEKNWTRWG